MAQPFGFPPNRKSSTHWCVGTADSTSLVLVPNKLVMQIDLHHMEKASDSEESAWPVIDHLVRMLPKINGRPYLAVFALTHPDQDHCRGFAELLRRVDIGELWHTPKIFRDNKDDTEGFCPDAVAFRNEAHRRRLAILNNPSRVPSGDRLRIIGHDDVLNEAQYRGLPETAKSRPGSIVTLVDGVNLAGHFEAFIHAPFSADQAADKNNTSLSMNVVLREQGHYAQFFFFGDREYPTIKQIFETTEYNKINVPYLYWHVMLCSHHCSKKVMYWPDAPDGDEYLRRDIMDYFSKYARPGAFIVSSSYSDFTDGSGHNPPHRKARNRYEEIVMSGRFICTHEYPSKADPVPLQFVVGANGAELYRPAQAALPTAPAAAGLVAAAQAARGAAKPPAQMVGFGLRGRGR